MTRDDGNLPSFSVVSYFCGCGGLDLGFRGDFQYRGEAYPKLPFEIKAAFDNNAACIETYNRFFGEHAQMVDLSAADARTIVTSDLLIGGFPCQEFSSCGPLGGLDSERGQLYKALIRYMEVHQPKLVVGENVINLERMEKGKVKEAIVNELQGAGYKVEVWKLYAPDYGIPQRRTRLFFICVRADLDGFPAQPRADFIHEQRSIEWAIGDLVEVTDESVPNQSQYFGASRAKRGNGQGDESSKRDKPAYTIRANPKSRVQFHYSLDRRLTVRECARIQTFPDDFVFTHAATSSISQIGNAVPPVLAYRVASSIAEYMKRLREV
ncbi:MAG: DNA cytosine methyltransferase [Selenomonadales bacterium]|nr:DNA cytosine methyltransferase [Selenomonadales bacterium]